MKKVLAEEYKQIVLSILIRVDEICKKNNITYCVFYGALLGSVRHGGYIPWDDDIDIIMTRNDYNKLMVAILSNPQYGLNFIDIQTNSKTVYAFAKICDIKTKVIDRAFEDVEGYGAFVDVFPYDYLPNDSVKRKKVMYECYLLNRIRSIGSRKKPNNEYKGIKRIKANIAFILSHFINSSAIVKKIDNIGRMLSKETTNFIGIVRNPKEVYPVEWIFPTQNIIFEGHIFQGPKEIEKCLRHEYGDYMELPPENKRIPHAIDCWIE